MPHLNNSKILFLRFCGDAFFKVTQKMVKKSFRSLSECIVNENEITHSMLSFQYMVTIALNFKLVKEANLIDSCLAFGYIPKRSVNSVEAMPLIKPNTHVMSIDLHTKLTCKNKSLI